MMHLMMCTLNLHLIHCSVINYKDKRDFLKLGFDDK